MRQVFVANSISLGLLGLAEHLLLLTHRNEDWFLSFAKHVARTRPLALGGWRLSRGGIDRREVAGCIGDRLRQRGRLEVSWRADAHTNARSELCTAERLSQVIDRTGFQAANNVLFKTLAAEHQNRERWR